MCINVWWWCDTKACNYDRLLNEVHDACKVITISPFLFVFLHCKRHGPTRTSFETMNKLQFVIAGWVDKDFASVTIGDEKYKRLFQKWASVVPFEYIAITALESCVVWSACLPKSQTNCPVERTLVSYGWGMSNYLCRQFVVFPLPKF